MPPSKARQRSCAPTYAIYPGWLRSAAYLVPSWACGGRCPRRRQASATSSRSVTTAKRRGRPWPWGSSSRRSPSIPVISLVMRWCAVARHHRLRHYRRPHRYGPTGLVPGDSGSGEPALLERLVHRHARDLVAGTLRLPADLIYRAGHREALARRACSEHEITEAV